MDSITNILDQYPEPQPNRPRAGMGLAIAGLVLGIVRGIVSLLVCFGPIALFFTGTGLLLSIMGLREARKGGGSTGLPVAAVIVSSVTTAIALLETLPWLGLTM